MFKLTEPSGREPGRSPNPANTTERLCDLDDVAHLGRRTVTLDVGGQLIPFFRPRPTASRWPMGSVR